MSKIDFSKIGYDYGIKPHFMIVGDINFSELFKKADCLGMLYMFTKSDKDEMIPCQIAFIFKNEEPAKMFLDILMGWVEKSNNDGDAVSMDFVENNDGGYTLAIYPEVGRLIERVIPKDLRDKVIPFIVGFTHYKTMDTLGQNYLNFKANYKKTEKMAVHYVIGMPPRITASSNKYFTKKEFNFFKENEIPANSMALGCKATREISDFNPKDLPKLPKDSIEDISKRRISEMKSLLPFTYNKLNKLWLEEIQKKLSLKYDSEIIKQAICNLTIFERLKQVQELSPDKYIDQNHPIRILEYLLSTYESFDSYYPSDSFYTEEQITQQIQNDRNELQTYLNR